MGPALAKVTTAAAATTNWNAASYAIDSGSATVSATSCGGVGVRVTENVSNPGAQ